MNFCWRLTRFSKAQGQSCCCEPFLEMSGQSQGIQPSGFFFHMFSMPFTVRFL